MCVVLVAGATSCSSSHRQAALPPRSFPRLARIFQPEVAGLGLRLTRASLVELTGGDPPRLTGHHLALYVEPTGQWSDDRYVRTIVPLTAVLARTVFGRWSQLSSFDVCQEPPPGVDDRPEPPPVSTVNLTRRAAAAVDWSSADLATLVRAELRDPGGVHLQVVASLRQDPTFAVAVARAQAS
jgi:hypothetical protein